RAPAPRTNKGGGVKPTAPQPRTGLFTPPGIRESAVWKRRCDSTRFATTSLLRITHPVCRRPQCRAPGSRLAVGGQAFPYLFPEIAHGGLFEFDFAEEYLVIAETGFPGHAGRDLQAFLPGAAMDHGVKIIRPGRGWPAGVTMGHRPLGRHLPADGLKIRLGHRPGHQG